MFREVALPGLVFSLVPAACNRQWQHAAASRSGQRPHFLVVLVDDRGYGGLPIYGNREV